MALPTSKVEPFDGQHRFPLPGGDSLRKRVVEEAANWLVHLTPHEMMRVLWTLDDEAIVGLGQRAERELARAHLRRWR